MQSTIEFRDEIVSRLQVDLVGPRTSNEILESKPSDTYVTGILWPIDSRMSGEDEDGDVGESEDDIGFRPTVVGQQRPASMGITFRTPTHEPYADVVISFGTYIEIEGDKKSWHRRAHEIVRKIDCQKNHSEQLANVDGDYVASLHIKAFPVDGGFITTVTLVNRRELKSDGEHVQDDWSIFQASLNVKLSSGNKFVPRYDINVASTDADEQSAQLLYRDKIDYAVGHQCSAGWDSTGGEIWTNWLPSSIVEAYSDTGSEVFKSIVSQGKLNALLLSKESKKEVLSSLNELVSAYDSWIDTLDSIISDLSTDLQAIAFRHKSQCEVVSSRMKKGLIFMDKNSLAFQSFQLANLAMHVQHSWKRDAEGLPLRDLSWKPFQMGFILLCIESMCNRESEERQVFDLLWFPTGGGKTEAYLALIAIASWHRRLVNPSQQASVVAIMRYTLRLLTAQQFERAVGMLMACEAIRLRVISSTTSIPSISAEFSAGLWVGQDATPNDFEGALKARQGKSSQSAEQLEKCFVCGELLTWHYDKNFESVNPHCESKNCTLGHSFGKWPVYTVDTNIYSNRPTLIIGTIDKFAQVPFKKEAANLFMFRTSCGPDLVIQDELHLISGPLGTISGLYETAFDWLMADQDRRVKIIGSTATIRRAEAQAKALFNRDSLQFPPPGLSFRDSGFAVIDPQKPGRLYVGVSSAGRSAKFTAQAAVGSALQSVAGIKEDKAEVKDGYWTLLYYFNSLRELGGAIVQVLDDVPDSMKSYANARSEVQRLLSPPDELTSRVSQKEIVEILNKLARPHWLEGSSDTVLATNMVSVGVDVARLGLMVMMGQPKTRSEYIQATSRVGRSAHPGLVISIFNVAKIRDRSHFETFSGWHGSIYKDVEATSVTPFSPRARERALKAALVAMIRYGNPGSAMIDNPDLHGVSDDLVNEILGSIANRAASIDPVEATEVQSELLEAMDDWDFRKPSKYENRREPNKALVERAEDAVKRIAAGKSSSTAWPLLNSMRSVEANTLFRMTEVLKNRDTGDGSSTPRPWRRNQNEE